MGWRGGGASVGSIMFYISMHVWIGRESPLKHLTDNNCDNFIGVIIGI